MAQTQNNNYTLKTEVTTISQNIENNTSTVNVKLVLTSGNHAMEHRSNATLTINGTEYYKINGTTVKIARNSRLVLADKTITVYHNQDGNKNVEITASFETVQKAWYTPSGKMQLSETIRLTTIPRASTITQIPQAITSDNAVISAVCDVKSTNFTNNWRLYYTINSVETTLTTTTNSQRFNYTIATNQIQQLATELPNQKNYTITLELTTKNNNTQQVIGVARQNITLTLSTEYSPIINSVALTETAQNIRNLTLGNNVFINNQSNITVNITATGKYGATIQSYKLTYGTQVFNVNNIQFIPKVEHTNVIVEVVDSRGLTATRTATIIVLPYFNPKITLFEVQRNNNGQGNKIVVNANAEIASLNGRNRMNITIDFKEKNASNWQVGYRLQDNTTANWNIGTNYLLNGIVDTSKQYDVRITVNDKLQSYSVTSAIGTNAIVQHLGSQGMAISGYLSDFNLKGLQLHGSLVDEYNKNYLLKAFPIGAIYLNIDGRNPETFLGGKWRQIAQGRTLVGLDTTQTEFNALKKTGGAKTHTLTLEQMPRHRHFLTKNQPHNSGIQFIGNTGIAIDKGSDHKGWWTQTNEQGGNQPHNNLQPYLVICIWERYE